ncbi:hypothetical protein [Halalkalicoccus jeotgali]|uniref:Transcriptional regulator n=1 Tax=Halalkalicoccus jeotgali (strain DSM 18796 / CECT 7217 / JCM 14584 / KCTC 4019 / B3) TaxID=795797 RepID=D8J9M4_HALJB|nr:hypothetical protein [Halalkalicoccus jeotgali]ADJ14436.1 hypothetical protein HacjB3_05225 [Halalkalicoccus jeotgali B3]ELY40152.1 hypothetical protein C497_03610 [Halalkalicoccus jeotgali B3]
MLDKQGKSTIRGVDISDQIEQITDQRMNRRNVNRSINQLVECGLVSKSEFADGVSHDWRLTDEGEALLESLHDLTEVAIRGFAE